MLIEVKLLSPILGQRPLNRSLSFQGSVSSPHYSLLIWKYESHQISLFCIIIKIKFKMIVMLTKPCITWLLLLLWQTCQVSIYSQHSVHIGFSRLEYMFVNSSLLPPVIWPCNAQKWDKQLPHPLDLDLAGHLTFFCLWGLWGVFFFNNFFY